MKSRPNPSGPPSSGNWCWRFVSEIQGLGKWPRPDLDQHRRVSENGILRLHSKKSSWETSYYRNIIRFTSLLPVQYSNSNLNRQGETSKNRYDFIWLVSSWTLCIHEYTLCADQITSMSIYPHQQIIEHLTARTTREILRQRARLPKVFRAPSTRTLAVESSADLWSVRWQAPVHHPS